MIIIIIMPVINTKKQKCFVLLSAPLRPPAPTPEHIHDNFVFIVSCSRLQRTGGPRCDKPEAIKYLQYNNTFIALLYPLAFSFELLQECCVGLLRIFFPQQLNAASRVSLTDRPFWIPPSPLY